MFRRFKSIAGFTMIELVMVIVIIGIIASVATTKLGGNIESAKYEQTKQELDQLAYAFAGNPNVYSSGARTDFGYVGDVGALPPNLDALVTNPGSYSTWDGPYIDAGPAGTEFKNDAWNVAYTYAGVVVRSTGSGSNIDKSIASASADLLSNTVSGYVVDADQEAPGTNFTDSLLIQMVYPDGSGGLATASTNPSANGSFSFAGIPIGNHTLRAIHVVQSDTVTHKVSVDPNSHCKLSIVFPADLW